MKKETETPMSIPDNINAEQEKLRKNLEDAETAYRELEVIRRLLNDMIVAHRGMQIQSNADLPPRSLTAEQSLLIAEALADYKTSIADEIDKLAQALGEDKFAIINQIDKEVKEKMKTETSD